jgi:1-deoxy-D-xylulose-5-phosphate synthase
MNEQELRNLMYTSQLESTTLPMVIRYPRGEGVMPEWRTKLEAIEIGKGRKLRDGEEVAILSFGHPGNFAKSAIVSLKQYGINPGHYDMRFAKPLDENLLHEVFEKYAKIVTIEDGTTIGGFGSAVLEFMAQHGYHAQVKMLGIPDRLVEHGSLKELHAECGYDANAIVATIQGMMENKVKVAATDLMQ